MDDRVVGKPLASAFGASQREGLEQVEFVRARDRLRAAAHGELAEEMVDVRFHRADGDDQRLRDLRVGFASRNQLQNLALALGERLDER